MPRLVLALACLACSVLLRPAFAVPDERGLDEGIQFRCGTEQRARIRTDMREMFRRMHIAGALVRLHEDPSRDTLTYTLNTPAGDTNTLDFTRRPEYWVHEQPVDLYDRRHAVRKISTVSLKEILLALLQHGRLTAFAGASCSVASLVEHMRLRQNVVAWVEQTAWNWPDGGPSVWNSAYWGAAGVKDRRKLFDAFEDVFVNQGKYAFGCYAAIKLAYAFGTMDFYRRVQKDAATFARIRHRLAAGDSPLDDIEPYAMWSFERDFDPARAATPGKLMQLQQGVSGMNFVPGDWVYFYNDDRGSNRKTGYEGSNGVYLGRGLFSDFYNDAEHHYTYEQKLDEVYQWRHGVFSQSRDYEKSELLSKDRLSALSASPSAGGLVLPLRAVPALFH